MKSRRQFVKIGSLALGFVAFLGSVGRTIAAPRSTILNWNGVVKETLMTCPVCAAKVTEKMSSEALRRIYHCPKCLAWLSTKKGDHCVYDSYGSIRCPRMQIKERRVRKLPSSGQEPMVLGRHENDQSMIFVSRLTEREHQENG
jgi:hypothetical protein